MPDMTLSDFLLAQITEDEEVARAATWVDADRKYSVYSYLRPGDAVHVLYHNPARVLVECAAKRRIVELHRFERDEIVVPNCSCCGRTHVVSSGWVCYGCDNGSEHRARCETLVLLALPYADHPDFREEWRP